MSYKTAIRIVSVDFYMSHPIQDLDVMYADFRGSSISQVPVIRIFGSTENGKKICLHVHGVFPYMYIPYDESEDFNRLKYQIAASIDKAVNVSFGQASSTAQHVYKIILVSGIPFYGYHAREHQFLKIFLFNPALVRKVSNLLQNEVILGRLYQPHESHIPYILQFMIDFNLHGMSRILLSDLRFRDNTPNGIPKRSRCELEADALCEHILNRFEVSRGNLGINPGIAALWEDERQRLRDKNEDSQIGPCLTLANSQVEPTKTHQVLRRALAEKLRLSEEVAEKTDQNISVYPAETPRSSGMKNASIIETHSSLTDSGTNESVADLNVTFDEDANDLFDILQDLGQKNLEMEEADCILSQVQNEEENEDEFDLSMSIADTTPFKNLLESLSDDGHNAILVPQLDGQSDDGSDCSKNNSENKNKSTVKYTALPIFVSSSAVNSGRDGLNESLEHAKRKLRFQNSDTVLCESTVECKYKNSNREYLSDLQSSVITKQNPATDIQNNRDISNENVTTGGERSQTKEDIFSDAENKTGALSKNEGSEENKETIRPSNECKAKLKESGVINAFKNILSAAELYDLQTNYKSKEGCSTKLTQDSASCELQSSSESDIFPSSGSNEVAPSRWQASLDLNRNEISPAVGLSPEANSVQTTFTLSCKPPGRTEVLESLDALGLPKVVHEKPFYGDANDVTGSVEIGHRVMKIPSKTAAHLEDFKAKFDGLDAYRRKQMPPNVKWTHENLKKSKLAHCPDGSCTVTPLRRPPSAEAATKWLETRNETSNIQKRKETIKKVVIPSSPGRHDESELELTLTQSMCEDPPSPVLGESSKKRGENSCRITGTTLNNTYGFKVTPENYQDARVSNEYQNLTLLSVEVHVRTRGDLKPDPAYDAVTAIFYSLVEDSANRNAVSGLVGIGIDFGGVDCQITPVENEEQLLDEFVNLVLKWDPDILVGYESELLSWGFLLERSQILEKPLLVSLSRMEDKTRSYSDEGLKVTGRILLDVWRLLRHEVALQSYTFESIAYHLLHRRIPLYSFRTLSLWWDNPLFRHRTIAYYMFRVEGVLQVLEQLDLIGRTSELARLFGIQFYEVLSRGSQFRVESMMLRLAKPLNYIAVSPSVQQRAKMKAPEFLPLILEPESKLYVDPVIVLDFQSLYPSVIIAYNYCFSTCLGRVTHLGRNTPFEFATTHLKISRARVKKLLDGDHLNFSPCGVVFVKRQIRDGILPRMLREILETRLMVKNSMKKNKADNVLRKILHNRQLGLKLIANVTYGYTAANFSGRMPAVELGDSVVSKGRETLQRAIEMVENTPKWRARVVYGDTDSLFVVVPGRSKEEAFEVGKMIADAVTESNPDPVKLKLEKVYHPCILQTKKRYVGYMYESPDQEEAVYDAKGIETVRRDGCPAVAKMLEKCIKILFETKDVSLVKKYVLRQFSKIMIGRISLQDLTFAKEYRGASGYRPGACVPALELARKWTAVDRRNEPRRGERVPYIIVSGPPGVPLIRLVRSPRDFLNDPSLRPNTIYYITKVIIPPVNRCFNLIGADLNAWFNQMPRKQFQYLRNASPMKKSTISQYFVSNACAVCSEPTQSSLCERCRRQHQRTVVVLHEKLRLWEQAFGDVRSICQTCTGVLDEAVCTSLDCPVLFRLHQTSRDLEQASYVREVVKDFRCKLESCP